MLSFETTIVGDAPDGKVAIDMGKSNENKVPGVRIADGGMPESVSHVKIEVNDLPVCMITVSCALILFYAQ